MLFSEVEGEVMDREFSYQVYFQMLVDGKFEKAEKYRRSGIPQKLYKYIWLEDESIGDADEIKRKKQSNGLKFSALRENYLWLSHVDKLNDPYEYKCMYVDEERLRKSNYSDSIISLLKKMLLDNMTKLGVTCFSEREPENNMPMWAYYSNNGRGFCIEYEVLSPKQIHKVSYEQNRISIARVLSDMVEEAWKNKKGQGISALKLEFGSNVLSMQLFMKHESWNHEKEYRLVYPLVEGASGCKVESKNAGLKVNRVIAGQNCSMEHRKILNTISNTLGCGDVYHVEMSEDSFISIVRR